MNILCVLGFHKWESDEEDMEEVTKGVWHPVVFCVRGFKTKHSKYFIKSQRSKRQDDPYTYFRRDL